MSRIPKLPVPAKENRPGLINRRPISRTVNGLSADDKKNLLLNHTKPAVQTGPTSSTTGARLKRAATAPAPTANAAKVTKVERKPPTAAPKIPPYDYKARFNDLLEKHKVIKNDYNDLKYKHEEVADDYEKIKESVESTSREKDMLKDKLLNALNDLRERTTELDSIKLDHEIQKRENEELVRKTKVLADVTFNLNKKTSEFDTLQEELNDLTRRHNALQEEAKVLREKSLKLATLSEDYDKLTVDYEEAKKKISTYETDVEKLQNILAGMYQGQRDLRNTIQDLKGNIRVYCRVRPPLESETNKPLFNLNVVDACTIEVEKVELNALSQSTRKGKSQHTFSFDGIFTPHSTQETVFEEVSNMIQSALDGYNVCIFAYGQTGSGKTYTMEGGCGPDQYGIIPRAFNFMFTCMEDLKRMGWQLTIKASFLEIYNEVIYDLLNSCKDQLSHDIKMVNSKGTDLYVSNLKEEEVKSSHDFIKLMIYAQRNRQTAATLNNERSSRSHSVTQIKISAINEIRKEKYTSQLNLVDLAGSESGKTTQRMDETKHINRSLSELSKVILSLQTNQAHIPYRNSKLTHLLMPSLGGNSKTLMLVNINQFDECFGETLNSLRLATKVNSCRTAKAKKNLTMVDT
ncbi:protein claret segregational [Leguminivora glycinivorella]|uniref:protein claret segregational n=1 Tax=Leguminivora glycinivorella TaxID=1035111 RepID=UPI00200D888A|nr:protein claret segregational [Leguminivora glycinivorella]